MAIKKVSSPSNVTNDMSVFKNGQRMLSKKYKTDIFTYFLFQVEGEKKSNIGNISSLPISIVKLKRIFEATLYSAKDEAGPTASKPGPTLLMQVTVAVKFVSKENKGSNAERASSIIKKQTIYKHIYMPRLESTLSSVR